MRLRGALGALVFVLGCDPGPVGSDGGAFDAPLPDGATADAPRLDGGGTCTTAADCDDRIFCNGAEQCMPSASARADGCVPAVSPCMASQTCDEDLNECQTACDLEADADGDGRRATSCGGDDCDDADPNRYPGNPEVCDASNHDEDCRPTTFGFVDSDTDGYIDAACCNTDAAGTLVCGDDCNDLRVSVHPDSTEACDGFDNDCDSLTDEGVLETYYRDDDGDAFGVDDAATNMDVCFRPTGYSLIDGDCNDDPAMSGNNIHPGAYDVCDGTIDHDCDGTVDNPPDGCACVVGDPPRPCLLPGACGAAEETCSVGTWDDAACRALSSAETCDGIDNDCDGQTDDGVTIECYVDPDGDRFSASGTLPVDVCPDPARPLVGGCPAGLTDRAPFGTDVDCDGANRDVFPGGTESCNGVDDDCDASVDESLRITCYDDLDNDAYAPVGSGGTLVCPDSSRAAFGMCPLFTTNRMPAMGADCADNNSLRSPGLPEICDLFMVDEDCDAMINEGVTIDCYADGDRDGYAPTGTTPTGLCADSGGNCPSGYTRTVPAVGTTDCNDGSAAIAPTRVEACNLVDDNCNAMIDEGVQTRFFRDGDNDLYGNSAMSLLACTAPGGYVTNSTDCNDAVSLIYPGATEVCNGLDDDCDTTPDDGLSTITVYRDADGDTYGNAAMSAMRCGAIGGFVLNATDCNDAPGTGIDIHPGASDLCGNGIDEDCSGTADLPLPVWYPDNDNDTYGANSGSVTQCAMPSTGIWVTRGGDCRDSVGFNFVYPGAPELCDGLDTDCDTTPNGTEIPNAFGLNFSGEDVDSDGHGNPACSPPPAILATVTPFLDDCNDSASNTYPGAAEIAGDEINQDCAVGELCFRDGDSDGFRNTDTSLRVTSADNDCDDATEGDLAESATDCNDASATVSPGDPELADNGTDDNCNGLFGCFYDVDNDGFSRSDAGVRDDSPNNSCLDAGEGATAEPRTDCNDGNAAISPGDSELADNGTDDNCNGLHGCFYDVDNDGFSRSDAAVRDDSPDVFCTASGEGMTSEPRTDCNDATAAVSPGAPELADNGISDDCDAFFGCYYDADNDAFSRSDAAVRDDSVDADCLDPGEGRSSEPRTDCCDSDVDAHPGQSSFFDTAVTCGGYDYNCNGTAEQLLTDLDSSCFGTVSTCGLSFVEGWSGTTIPGCGVSRVYNSECSYMSGCMAFGASMRQSCR